jgi:hypothetical protein
MASIDLPANIADAASWASPEELVLLGKLLAEDQAHLFSGFRLGEDLPQKHAFFEQVR